MLLNCGVGEDESPLDCKRIKPVNPQGNQSWIFTGRTDVEAETPILWPPDAKSWLIWKDADAGKDWGHEEKGMTEDEMVGWHHRLNGHGFGWTPAVGDGQGGLACCGSWGRKETGLRLNWTECSIVYIYHIFIHCCVNGHLGCFYVLAIVNSAAMNTGMHVSFRIMNFSGCTASNAISGSYSRSFFKKKKAPYCSPYHYGDVNCINLHPHQKCLRVPFSPHLL